MICLICGAPKPHRTTALICSGCRRDLSSWLNPRNVGNADKDDPGSIPALFAQLDVRTRVGGSDGGRRCPGVSHAAPIDVGVSSLLDPRTETSAFAVLKAWVRVLKEGCPLGPLVGRWTVADLAGLLHTHVDWCSEQMWIDEFHADLRALHAQLRRAVPQSAGEAGAEPVGRCPEVDLNGRQCRGPLWHDGDLIGCVRCQQSWDRLTGWMRLGAALSARRAS